MLLVENRKHSWKKSHWSYLFIFAEGFIFSFQFWYILKKSTLLGTSDQKNWVVYWRSIKKNWEDFSIFLRSSENRKNVIFRLSWWKNKFWNEYLNGRNFFDLFLDRNGIKIKLLSDETKFLWQFKAYRFKLKIFCVKRPQLAETTEFKS